MFDTAYMSIPNIYCSIKASFQLFLIPVSFFFSMCLSCFTYFYFSIFIAKAEVSFYFLNLVSYLSTSSAISYVQVSTKYLVNYIEFPVPIWTSNWNRHEWINIYVPGTVEDILHWSSHIYSFSHHLFHLILIEFLGWIMY